MQLLDNLCFNVAEVIVFINEPLVHYIIASLKHIRWNVRGSYCSYLQVKKKVKKKNITEMKCCLQSPRNANNYSREFKENNRESLFFDDVYEHHKSYNVLFLEQV